MLTRDDRSHFAEPCLSNARHRHRIWVRVYGGACDGMDGLAAQQPGGTPYRVMAAWRHGGMAAGSAHLPEECQAITAAVPGTHASKTAGR